MTDIATYHADIELALVSSPIIADYQVVRSWIHTDAGYIRIRATLSNGDFLEAAEYFAVENERGMTIDYHYQWTDSKRQTLRRRWDSTPDHPGLDNFPHHVHVNTEETLIAGQPTSLVGLVRLLESELL